MGFFAHLVRGTEDSWTSVQGPDVSCSYGDWCDLEEMIEENICGMRNYIELDADNICFNLDQIENEYEEIKNVDISETLAERTYLSNIDRLHYKYLLDAYKALLKEAVSKKCLIRYA